MGLPSLQHMKRRRSACRGRSPARQVPPSGFDHPLDGLLPSMPCRFCFAPAALMGFALRSVPLSKGNRPFPARKNPHTVHSSVYPHTVKRRGRLDKLRFLGFGPSESPWRPGMCLARRPLVAPLGFALPGFTDRSLDRDFARPPLARFSDKTLASPAAPQSIDRLPLVLARRCRQGRQGWVRNPHRVSAPSRS
jgi:hypothetical protein